MSENVKQPGRVVIPDGWNGITVRTGKPGYEVSETFAGRVLIAPVGIFQTSDGRIAVYSPRYGWNAEVEPATLEYVADLDDAALLDRGIPDEVLNCAKRELEALAEINRAI